MTAFSFSARAFSFCSGVNRFLVVAGFFAVLFLGAAFLAGVSAVVFLAADFFAAGFFAAAFFTSFLTFGVDSVAVLVAYVRRPSRIVARNARTIAPTVGRKAPLRSAMAVWSSCETRGRSCVDVLGTPAARRQSAPRANIWWRRYGSSRGRAFDGEGDVGKVASNWVEKLGSKRDGEDVPAVVGTKREVGELSRYRLVCYLMQASTSHDSSCHAAPLSPPFLHAQVSRCSGQSDHSPTGGV